MKHLIMAGVCAFMLCACTTEQVDEIHRTVGAVLEIAYTNGGAVLVSQRIDELVVDGKITEAQATALKNAAQQSYELLQQKLTELQVSDVKVTE